MDASDSGDVTQCGKPREFIPSPPITRERVGDCLKEVLGELDIDERDGCGCASMVAKMNSWGIGGCQEHRETILCHLRTKAKERGWAAIGWAAFAALKNRPVWLNPLTPYTSMLDEACRRSGANQ